MDDDKILKRGGTQEDINSYAHDNGACGAIYGGTCDVCGKTDTTNPRVNELPVDILINSIIGKNELTDVQCIKLVTYVKNQLSLKDIEHAKALQLAKIEAFNFETHTKDNRVQKLDENHISITSGGISFGKTKPLHKRVVIEYDTNSKAIRFHEAGIGEYGISYKIGVNRVSGVYGFRARPFEGILPTGYYRKVSDNTYRLSELTKQKEELENA